MGSRRITRLIATATVAAIAIPVGVGLATTTSEAVPRSVSLPNVHIKKLPSRVLLTSGQLGAGWSTIDPAQAKKLLRTKVQKFDPTKLGALLAGVTVSPTECKDAFTVPQVDSVRGAAVRGFRQGRSAFGPYAGTAVLRFATAAQASAALEHSRAIAAACSDITVETKYGNIQAQVSPMSLPIIGDERVGYTVTATVAGFVTVEGQVGAVREGRTLVLVGQGGLSPSEALTRSMARKATAKL